MRAGYTRIDLLDASTPAPSDPNRLKLKDCNTVFFCHQFKFKRISRNSLTYFLRTELEPVGISNIKLTMSEI